MVIGIVVIVVILPSTPADSCPCVLSRLWLVGWPHLHVHVHVHVTYKMGGIDHVLLV